MEPGTGWLIKLLGPPTMLALSLFDVLPTTGVKDGFGF